MTPAEQLQAAAFILREQVADSDLTRAGMKVEETYGDDDGLVGLLMTVRNDETIHQIDQATWPDDRRCVPDCSGCRTELIAAAVVGVVLGGAQ